MSLNCHFGAPPVNYSGTGQLLFHCPVVQRKLLLGRAGQTSSRSPKELGYNSAPKSEKKVSILVIGRAVVAND